MIIVLCGPLVWLNIPYDYREAEKDNESSHLMQEIQLIYPSTTGIMLKKNWRLDRSSMEGRMIFFPSQISHMVYPHHTWDMERSTVSTVYVLQVISHWIVTKY